MSSTNKPLDLSFKDIPPGPMGIRQGDSFLMTFNEREITVTVVKTPRPNSKTVMVRDPSQIAFRASRARLRVEKLVSDESHGRIDREKARLWETKYGLRHDTGQVI